MSKNNFQNVLFSLGLVHFLIAFYYTIVLFSNFDLGNLIDNLNTKEPNEIGDTVGGILNPLFAISICIFTGLAFYAQYEANKQVKNQFNNERTQTLIFKAIENKETLISSTFRYGVENSLERIIKNLSESLEKRIIRDFGNDIIYSPEKHERNLTPNRFIKNIN